MSNGADIIEGDKIRPDRSHNFGLQT